MNNADKDHLPVPNGSLATGVTDRDVADSIAAVDWYCAEHRYSLSFDGDSLFCQAGHSVPVRSGIPRFVGGNTYADAFGEQWIYFSRTQLDSYTGLPISRSRLRRCLGEDLWAKLPGCRILECGCGAGRFTEVLLAEGANVVSVDLSKAVESNGANCGLNRAHAIAQADIENLPFRPQSFDVVLCLGVLQHTPDPEKTLASLYRHVAPGGSLVVDNYRFTWAWYTKTAPLFRMWLKRMPPAQALRITNGMVDLLLPVHKRVAHIPIVKSIWFRISPVLTYYRDLPELSDELQKEWARLDTHDSLTDWYKNFRTRPQIIAALTSLGVTEIWCENGGNGVEARGKRPRNSST